MKPNQRIQQGDQVSVTHDSATVVKISEPRHRDLAVIVGEIRERAERCETFHPEIGYGAEIIALVDEWDKAHVNAMFTASIKANPSLAVAKLLVALKQTTATLQELVVGETCDHSVNICFCGVFRDIEDAQEIIKATESLKAVKP